MIGTILAIILVIALFFFISWRKYRHHQRSSNKQWEGENPSQEKKSTEELRQNENKYRGFGQIGGGGDGM